MTEKELIEIQDPMNPKRPPKKQNNPYTRMKKAEGKFTIAFN